MPRLRLNITMSLDGYVAGPDQSLEEPLGRGGMRLHDWAVELEAWRAEHGLEGGEVNASTEAIELSREHTGATIMGRKMFGGGPGPWREDEPWNGWWGDDPPFHHPVFVLTHHPRPRLDMAGGTSFVFVTDGIESALEQARDAAGDADISLAGGAATANQFLAAGLVDGMLISVAPVLLGSGERLFEGVGDLHGLRLQRAISGPAATHLVLSR